MSKLGSARNAIVNRLLGIDLHGLIDENRAHQRDVDRRLEIVLRRTDAQTELLRRERDGLPTLVEGLGALRLTSEYEGVWDVEEPHISVRIASYQNTEALMDLAIPSVLAQSYQNFELIIVNDGPNDVTREALAKLDEPRIHYEEFPERTRYPSDPHARWLVAGSPGMNRGADLARGHWIAPLDEDDSFTPDHLEKLLGLAVRERAEVAYGALIQHNLATGAESRIWSYPPAISKFSFQGAIYLRALNSLFRYDESSWIVGEPGDWNLIRRMNAAGVRMAAVDEIVGTMNHLPYTHKAE